MEVLAFGMYTVLFVVNTGFPFEKKIKGIFFSSLRLFVDCEFGIIMVKKLLGMKQLVLIISLQPVISSCFNQSKLGLLALSIPSILPINGW